MLLSPAIFIDASLDSLQYVSDSPIAESKPRHNTSMCPYKAQREKIPISLNVLAMILKQNVG